MEILSEKSGDFTGISDSKATSWLQWDDEQLIEENRVFFCKPTIWLWLSSYSGITNLNHSKVESSPYLHSRLQPTFLAASYTTSAYISWLWFVRCYCWRIVYLFSTVGNERICVGHARSSLPSMLFCCRPTTSRSLVNPVIVHTRKWKKLSKYSSL